jgi:uncharacterized coiled-coil protein SlyX
LPTQREPTPREIETKLSLAEDLLVSLNDTFYHQQRQFEQLQRVMVTLREQVRGTTERAAVSRALCR